MANNDELTQIIYDFFYKFSRFEFALKKHNYRKAGYNNNAEPDWHRFIKDFENTYQTCESANQLLKSPPRRQIIKNGNLDWEDLSFGRNDSLLKKVSRSIKTIRNNLFHGGKYGDKYWDNPDRIKFLLENGNSVIEQLTKLDSALLEYYSK